MEGEASRGLRPQPAICPLHDPPRGGAQEAKISAGGEACSRPLAALPRLRGRGSAPGWAPAWAPAAGAGLPEGGAAGAREVGSAVQAARRAPPPNFPWSRRSRRLSGVRPRGVRGGHASSDSIVPRPPNESTGFEQVWPGPRRCPRLPGPRLSRLGGPCLASPAPGRPQKPPGRLCLQEHGPTGFPHELCILIMLGGPF